MSIFNVNPDPDWPVLSGPGFVQATYQPYNQPMGAPSYYYNGMTVVPTTPQVGVQPDSRRYDTQSPAYQQNAMFQQPVFQQPVAQQPQTFGFNQLAESRRTQTTAPAVMNPWAVQTVQQVQPVMQPVVQQFVPQTQVTTVSYPVTFGAGSPYAALSACHPMINKKNAWGEQQVYNPTPAPVINWANVGVQTAPQQCTYALQPMAQQPQMTYPQPVFQQPVQQSWEELAKQNFCK